MRGIPVRLSFPSFIVSPASALPRKPCSGANTFTTLMFSCKRVSSRQVCSSPTMEVWLTTIPTRFPFSSGRYSSVRSAPVARVPSAKRVLMPINRLVRMKIIFRCISVFFSNIAQKYPFVLIITSYNR